MEYEKEDPALYANSDGAKLKANATPLQVAHSRLDDALVELDDVIESLRKQLEPVTNMTATTRADIDSEDEPSYSEVVGAVHRKANRIYQAIRRLREIQNAVEV